MTGASDPNVTKMFEMARGLLLARPRVILWVNGRRKGIVCKLEKLDLEITVYYFGIIEQEGCEPEPEPSEPDHANRNRLGTGTGYEWNRM